MSVSEKLCDGVSKRADVVKNMNVIVQNSTLRDDEHTPFITLEFELNKPLNAPELAKTLGEMQGVHMREDSIGTSQIVCDIWSPTQQAMTSMMKGLGNEASPSSSAPAFSRVAEAFGLPEQEAALTRVIGELRHRNMIADHTAENWLDQNVSKRPVNQTPEKFLKAVMEELFPMQRFI